MSRGKLCIGGSLIILMFNGGTPKMIERDKCLYQEFNLVLMDCMV